MDRLVPVVNHLQEVLATLGPRGDVQLDLPQIAVVGSQSVGKTSVLESLVGREFLPRGVGIVTRRPLILQLRRITEERPDYGEFHHLPNQTFEDFQEVRAEIDNDTEKVCGKNKALSPQPIILRIFSRNVIDLTLIDLPGLTKVPVGDQPQDIELRIHELVMQHVSKPNVLILAVTAANTDIANSEALKIAKQVDPEMHRTIGVLTKLDLMDEGTDASEVLLGKVYPLRLGFIPVVCRGQKALQTRSTIRDSLQKEEEFFQKHPAYRSMGSRCGTPFLSKRLNQLLMDHIKATLPDLRNRIHSLTLENEQDLQGLGDPISHPSAMGPMLLSVFSTFSRKFADLIEGKGQNNATTELSGGARIHYIFHDIYARALLDFDPFSGLDEDEIRATIRNAAGPRATLFVPEAAFEILVKKQVAQFEAPGLECAELVFDELTRLVSQCEVPEMQRFPKLREEMIGVFKEIVRKCLTPTNQMISNIVQMELAYINTNHPDFIGGSAAAAAILSAAAKPAQDSKTPNSVERSNSIGSMTGTGIAAAAMNRFGFDGFFGGPKRVSSNGSIISSEIKLQTVPDVVSPPTELSEKEKKESEIIRTMLGSYLQIVAKTCVDMVPKAIMHFMVNPAKEVMQQELMGALYREDLFHLLMEEVDGMQERRERCRENLAVLRKAAEVIASVRDADLDR